MKKKYDVIIIGAGIGGLVCGCYLAKAGKKVLIIEKNRQPGGYCTSFQRKGFKFDACVHSLGALGKNGNITKVLKDLDIDKRIKIKRNNPSDIIISPDYKINFWNELDRVIVEFQDAFPKEAKNIKRFFDYLNESKGISSLQLRSKTFKELLDSYFFDRKLKAIFSIFLLGNAGLPDSLISAFTAVKVYKEFMIDGGYYPEGGMQALPDLLLRKFKELGGSVLLNSLVMKIECKDKKVEGVRLSKNNYIQAKNIISNSDASYTFLQLIGKENVERSMVSMLDRMIPSLSMFILYLGIKKDINELPLPCTNLWFMPHYNIENMYNTAIKGRVENLDWFLTRVLPDKRSILTLVNMPFKNKKYWSLNKKRLIDIYIKKTEQVIPNISNYILFKDAATPNTLCRWTLNHNGSAYGWASTPAQFMIHNFYKPIFLKNLYLVGHWSTLAQGISGVAYLGRKIANTILLRKNSYV